MYTKYHVHVFHQLVLLYCLALFNVPNHVCQQERGGVCYLTCSSVPPLAQLPTAQTASFCMRNLPTCRAVMTIGTRLASITICIPERYQSITPVISGVPHGTDLDMMCVACHDVG